MTLGIPNVSKSTMINALSGRAIAKTGYKPTFTRHQQRVKASKDLVLQDTPGFLWPRLEPAVCGYRLAVIGSISVHVVEAQQIAWFAVAFLAERDPERLQQLYGTEELPEGEEAIMEAIRTRRGILRKGGLVDLERASKALLRDLGSGALGRVQTLSFCQTL